MAPKLSGGAVLGGHHLYVTPRTMTGVIRTATRNTKLPRNAEEASRSFAMATVCIAAAMKITGCGPGSQSVKLILLLIEISAAYARDLVGRRANLTKFFIMSRHNFSARIASKNQGAALYMIERGPIFGPERKWPPGTWPSDVRFRPSIPTVH